MRPILVRHGATGTSRRVTVRQGPTRDALPDARARVTSGNYRLPARPEHRDDWHTHTRAPACERHGNGACRGTARLYRLPDAARARSHASVRVILCDAHAVRPR